MLKAKGLLDWEIAKEWGISDSALYNWKRCYGVVNTPVRRNKMGVKEEDIAKAAENGISRRLFLRRIREYGWSVELAIREPVGSKLRVKRKS